MTSGEKKEYVAIAVSGPGMEKEFFLQDVMVESGTGTQVSGAVVQALIEWAILLRIIALAYDTCSVNTGVTNGIDAKLFFSFL